MSTAPPQSNTSMKFLIAAGIGSAVAMGFLYNKDHFALEAESESEDEGTTKPIPKSKEEVARIRQGMITNRLVRLLDEEQKRKMIELMVPLEFKEGELVIQQGSHGKYFYIVESGVAEIFTNNGATVRHCYPGDSFGEGGFILGTRRSGSVKAKTPLTLWVVDEARFRKEILPSSSRLKKIFESYASICDPNTEEPRMTQSDFWRSTDMLDEFKDDQSQSRFGYLFELFDTDKSGQLDFSEFALFDIIASQPDADFDLAFRVFDVNRNGVVNKSDVINALTKETSPSGFRFNPNCNLMNRFFGSDGKRELRPPEFSQFFLNLTEEIPRQLFSFYDKQGNGYISGEELSQLVKHFGSFRMPNGIRDRIIKMKCLNSDNEMVTYGEFIALNEFLNHIPALGGVIEHAVRNKGHPLNKEEFKMAVKSMANNVSPLEVDLIFTLFDTNRDGRLDHKDFKCVTYFGRSCSAKELDSMKAKVKELSHSRQPKSIVGYVTEFIEHFGLGAIAGGIGAATVYPIDLVKTRMQNQRAIEAAQRLYKNSFDCFFKVIQKEGALGLYKGLLPQLMGVAPEKAIKLTVNDLLRDMFTDETKGKIYFPLEVLAGCGAGASQVVFTNPLEIVKIRLQVQGETAKLSADFKPKSAVSIVKELGLGGLYKGAGACLLRDIPFSGIYFPAYAAAKKSLTRDDGSLRPIDLLIAGAAAGVPAASLTTPADVIKTRLQVEARKGEQTYSGITDCARQVYKTEGFRAFWKGAGARVFRSSPQFGVTLLSYELLQRFLAPELTPRPPTNAPVSVEDFDTFRRENVGSQMKKATEKLTLVGKKND